MSDTTNQDHAGHAAEEETDARRLVENIADVLTRHAAHIRASATGFTTNPTPLLTHSMLAANIVEDLTNISRDTAHLLRDLVTAAGNADAYRAGHEPRLSPR